MASKLAQAISGESIESYESWRESVKRSKMAQ